MRERPTEGAHAQSQGPPDGCQVAIVVHDVEVGHGAVALLFPGLILHLLQGHPLGEGINAQDLCGLQENRKRRSGEEKLHSRLWKQVKQSRRDPNAYPPRQGQPGRGGDSQHPRLMVKHLAGH